MMAHPHRATRTFRQRAARLVALAALLSPSLPACSRAAPHAARIRRVMVLGLDGMDHGMVSKWLRQGKLPNLARLARQGSFLPLETSVPPQSPSAWSNFITGMQPGHHGIFDFIQRDPATLEIYLSTSRVREGRRITLGDLAIPLGGGEAELLRKEKPFWWYLERAGVPSTIIKIPAHFPPRDDGGARVITDMGTPDMLGTYGTFTLLSSDRLEARKHFSGGRVALLSPAGHGALTGKLEGPADPLSAAGKPLVVSVRVEPDPVADGLWVRMGDQERVLARGEWSDWVALTFGAWYGINRTRGMVRLYVKSVAPEVRIYVSPINIDPLDPALPISSPPGFAAELARRDGRFYTQGMPEDTKALTAGVLSRDEFLTQAGIVHQERIHMYKDVLSRFRSGFLYFYFGSTDQITHMFFRAYDVTHPAHGPADAPYKDVVLKTYQEADQEVGRAMAALSDDDLLLVISDHGFGPASYLFDLNGWLVREGYLVLRRKPLPEPMGHIDWSKTQAYGLGLNGLYINLKGREKHGAVPPERAEALLERLTADLKSIYHPETGARVVTEVVRPSVRYPGPEVAHAPDLIVGYGRGFKVADASAAGGVGRQLFRLNRGDWNGDHCGDHRLVPGILFCNHKVARSHASLLDLAPTVAAYFGVARPKGWVGHDLLASPPASAGPH